jgi:TPR repeat protein
MVWHFSPRVLGNSASRLALAIGIAAMVPAASLAQQPPPQVQMGTSFDCSRAGAGRGIPTLVCQTPELQLADLHQMQAYYTLRHAQPERQQELRNQYTARIQGLVRDCSTEQVRASGSQPACVAQALRELRNFWGQQIQQTGNAAALEEMRLPSGNFVGAQHALRTSGFLPANAVVDGVYGSGTREAIARLQAERGIASNGFLTQTTLAAIRQASVSGASTSTGPVAAGSATSPSGQQPAGSTNQNAHAQPPQRAQTNSLSTISQTAPRPAVSPGTTDNETREQLAAAQRALDTRDYATALRIYSPLAERGVAAAQGGMARLYANGWGVTRNDPEAIRWARLGAAQNDSASLNILGVRHSEGRGVERNDAEAVRWFRLSAEQGNALGQNNLGFMLREGRGVERNDAEAVRWFRLSAEQGNALGQLNLGLVLQEGRGTARNTEEALRWYRLSAAQGNTTAQERVAQLAGTTEARRILQDYRSRDKTILEQVLNYTSNGRENGIFTTDLQNNIVGGGFWISGYNRTHRCVLTSVMISSGGFYTESIDLRDFNEAGFRIQRFTRGGESYFIIGDERRQIQGSGAAVMERLQNAWGLAFRECPGRRSAF